MNGQIRHRISEIKTSLTVLHSEFGRPISQTNWSKIVGQMDGINKSMAALVRIWDSQSTRYILGEKSKSINDSLGRLAFEMDVAADPRHR